MPVLVVYAHTRQSQQFKAMQEIDFALPTYDPEKKYLMHNAFIPMPDFIKQHAFEGIVFTHSFFSMLHSKVRYDKSLEDWSWIIDHPARTIALPQDDYMCSESRDNWYVIMNVNAVFPVCDEETWPKLIPKYLKGTGQVLQGYTSYMTPALRRQRDLWLPFNKRTIDIGYRTLGQPRTPNRMGQLKYDIAQKIQSDTALDGMNIDVSSDLRDQIRGEKWLEFLGNSKASIATPSGSSIRVPNHASLRMLTEATDRGRRGIDLLEILKEDDLDTDYEALSPRNFECAALGTVQILTPGHYGGMFVSGLNSLSIDSDASNLNALIPRISDDTYMQKIAAKAAADFLSNSTLQIESLIQQVNSIISHGDSSSSQDMVFEKLKSRHEKYQRESLKKLKLQHQVEYLTRVFMPPSVKRLGMRVYDIRRN